VWLGVCLLFRSSRRGWVPGVAAYPIASHASNHRVPWAGLLKRTPHFKLTVSTFQRLARTPGGLAHVDFSVLQSCKVRCIESQCWPTLYAHRGEILNLTRTVPLVDGEGAHYNGLNPALLSGDGGLRHLAFLERGRLGASAPSVHQLDDILCWDTKLLAARTTVLAVLCWGVCSSACKVPHRQLPY
jgi:hypothetical protein